MVKLLNPQIGETIYDPFCGTGGMLIVAFKHIMNSMVQTESNIERLKKFTLYGSELTKTASIAKMNMILSGDGHSNIRRQDSFANPCDNQYDIVITNYPFAQKTRYGDKYVIPDRNGDIISPQHCLRALKEGGRMAMIAPDGFLSNTNSKAYSDVRKYLLDNTTLKSVISLPRGAFEPYNRAKASILYFTDAKKSKTKKYYWFFDVKNDGYTLDKKRKKIDGDNDLELVLSENNLENQDTRYLIKLGINQITLNEVINNGYILNAIYYRKNEGVFKYDPITFEDLFELSGKDKIGEDQNAPVMSITMESGLIDQKEKFKKRIASSNISKYKKVYRNELVVGFPIDEGVLGFQTKYKYAAVSPAYKIWRLKKKDINIPFLDMLLRAQNLREIYKTKMQGSVDRRRSIPDDIFIQIRIPLPPKNIQDNFVKKQQEIENFNRKIKAIKSDIQHDINSFWQLEEN